MMPNDPKHAFPLRQASRQWELHLVPNQLRCNHISFSLAFLKGEALY